MMTEADIGNAAQTRAIVEQAAEATIALYTRQHPEIGNSSIPVIYKWVGGFAGTIFTVLSLWLVSTVSDMRITLARVDERSRNNSESGEVRLLGLERRIGNLEENEKENSR